MKVVLINGSPNAKGCVSAALDEVARELNRQGVETELMHIGREAIHGCIDCGKCRELGHCAFDDVVNRAANTLAEADGMVFGTPVYFAGMAGQMKCFMDRLFFSAKSKLAYKPAAGVVSARRGGCTATFDELNKYFMLNSMPVVSSQYWNQVHGSSAQDVQQDEEGLQIMRTLGRNMAWMLKCIECGKQNGIALPKAEEKSFRTDFIR